MYSSEANDYPKQLLDPKHTNPFKLKAIKRMASSSSWLMPWKYFKLKWESRGKLYPKWLLLSFGCFMDNLKPSIEVYGHSFLVFQSFAPTFCFCPWNYRFSPTNKLQGSHLFWYHLAFHRAKKWQKDIEYFLCWLDYDY